MTGLMYPKMPTKKKKKKHKKSILQDQTIKHCFLCMMEGDYREKPVDNHHVFYGQKCRQHSEAEGLTVNLCRERHHEHGPESVHGNPNKGNDLILKQVAQVRYERDHTRKEFMDKFEKNYL